MSKPESPDDEPVVHRVAKAIYDAAVKQSLDRIAAAELPLAEIERVFVAAHKASDREAAIVIFCLVDDLATSFFRERLTGAVSGGVEETMLSGNGMLASAYNKITLLSALNWIRARVYRDLGFMRKIRNAFAHDVSLSRFDQSPIRDFINSMDDEVEKNIIRALDSPALPPVTVRKKFLVRSILTAAYMISDFRVSQAAIEHGVHPGSILAGEFDSRPENIKNLLRTASRISLQCLLGEDIELTPEAERALANTAPSTSDPSAVRRNSI
jgi:DNA-binding MltR family transcriptional regulator